MPASAAGDGRKTALAKIYHAITNDKSEYEKVCRMCKKWPIATNFAIWLPTIV